MSTEPTTAAPVDEKPEEVMEEHAEKKKGFCPDDWALNCYDPNGDGPGQATCLCKVYQRREATSIPPWCGNDRASLH